MKFLNTLSVVFALALSACAVDAGSQTEAEPGSAQLSSQESELAAPPTSSKDVSTPGGDIDINAGCSTVQYCDAPGATEGTRCLQQGCTWSEARTECINEGWAVCGTPKCSWKLIGLNGVAYELCG